MTDGHAAASSALLDPLVTACCVTTWRTKSNHHLRRFPAHMYLRTPVHPLDASCTAPGGSRRPREPTFLRFQARPNRNLIYQSSPLALLPISFRSFEMSAVFALDWMSCLVPFVAGSLVIAWPLLCLAEACCCLCNRSRSAWQRLVVDTTAVSDAVRSLRFVSSRRRINSRAQNALPDTCLTDRSLAADLADVVKSLDCQSSDEDDEVFVYTLQLASSATTATSGPMADSPCIDSVASSTPSTLTEGSPLQSALFTGTISDLTSPHTTPPSSPTTLKDQAHSEESHKEEAPIAETPNVALLSEPSKSLVGLGISATSVKYGGWRRPGEVTQRQLYEREILRQIAREEVHCATADCAVSVEFLGLLKQQCSDFRYEHSPAEIWGDEDPPCLTAEVRQKLDHNLQRFGDSCGRLPTGWNDNGGGVKWEADFPPPTPWILGPGYRPSKPLHLRLRTATSRKAQKMAAWVKQ
jgi:hypothetical protein